MKIRAQGRVVDVDASVLTYDEVVSLVGMRGSPTVTYCRGHRDKPEGCLAPRETLPIVDGLVICVAHTGDA